MAGIESLFSEAKRLKVALTIGHQHLAQISPQLQATLLGNVGTVIVFRVGGEAAERLERELMPVFQAKDIMNLGVREFYIKMTIDGETYDPFSAEVLKLYSPEGETFREDIINAVRRNYSRAG